MPCKAGGCPTAKSQIAIKTVTLWQHLISGENKYPLNINTLKSGIILATVIMSSMTKSKETMMKLTTTLMTLTMLAAPVAIAGENNWEKGAKDAWIDGKAETTLLLNTNLNSFDINTDVKDGVVVLTGKVDSEVDKSLASELIESLDGVNKVDNRLEVMSKDKPSEMAQTLTDSKVVAVVKTRLLIESEVTGTDINVDAKQGVVTLQGTVASDAERDLAITIAKNTSDVKKVVDKLEVVEKS